MNRRAGIALALAAAALVAFSFLTTMHERYAYAAVVFLAVLVEDRRARWLGLALGVVFTLNLVAAASKLYLGGILSVTGPNGIAGSILMLAITLALVLEVLRAARPSDAGTPPDTSAGSAGATSAA